MRNAWIAVVVMGLAAVAQADDLDTAGLRLNQLQVIGTHNSYKAPIDPPLLRLMTTFDASARELDYSHPPLSEQLDLGVRSLELDVYHDPEGGLYATPRGLELVRAMGETPAAFDTSELLRPGFKVLHVSDVDFRSKCPAFDDALAELAAWSDRNPRHLPIVVTMNLKDEAAPIPDATQPAPFDAAALDALDEAIRAGLGAERLITPDLVRGDSNTLEEAVLSGGWPHVDETRGRFLWVIDERDEKRRRYVEGHPSLRGRVGFTTSDPGSPEAAFLILNNPVGGGEAIRRRVEEGYLVRTRADAGTLEARRDDLSRFEAAKRSGAQVISTDYPYPDKPFATGYRVSFEGERFARPNPLTAPGRDDP